MNDVARHRRELFVAALDLPSAEREAFLHRECPDVGLCAEVLELLSIDPPEIFLAPPDLVTDSRLCQVFGPYRAEPAEDLGAGQQLARHVASGQLVAIEVQPLPADDDRVTAFVRTAHRVVQMRHLACVRVHEHGRGAMGFWFARDHVDGHDLACELDLQGGLGGARRGRAAGAVDKAILPPVGTREWLQAVFVVFERVVEGLGAAHRAGIAHGDVRASRILLDREGRAHLSGFGVASLAGRTASPAQDLASVCALLQEVLVDALEGRANEIPAAERANLRELLRRTNAAVRRPYLDAVALLADLRSVRSGGAPAGHGWLQRLVNWMAWRSRPRRDA
jgi:hypothetical protein